MKKLHLCHDEYFDINKEDIVKANYKQLVHCIKIGLSISFVMSLFRLATKQYVAFTTQFIPFLIFFVVLHFMNVFIIKKRREHVVFILYVIISLLLGFGIVIGSVTNPNEQAITFLAFIVVMPLFVFDKKCRMIAYITVMSIIFLIYSYIYKDKSLFIPDAVNLSFFYTTSIAFYVFITNERIKNIKNSAKLKRIAELDFLTGLYNRKKLYSCFEDSENKASNKRITSVFIADIDYFKQYNDEFGHIAGDACIKIVSKEIKNYCHSNNMEVFRYGGEEFVAIGYGLTYDNTLNISEEIVKRIANKSIVSAYPQYPMVTLSIGIATIESVDIQDCEKLLLYADRALYHAKATGRNKAVEYLDGM